MMLAIGGFYAWKGTVQESYAPWESRTTDLRGAVVGYCADELITMNRTPNKVRWLPQEERQNYTLRATLLPLSVDDLYAST